jgi:hypothetical protein
MRWIGAHTRNPEPLEELLEPGFIRLRHGPRV